MLKQEKMRKVKNLRILHPRLNKALDLIKTCQDSTKISSDPQCLIIDGSSGTGKSTIFNIYRQIHERTTYTETGTKKSILWAILPSPIRIPTFLETLLERLGDPFPTRGTIGNKYHRLVHFIKDCEVELIMLDEFQQFLHPENQKINYDVSECFKALINLTNVPVVLFGLEEANRVIDCNPQLKRRFSMRYSLQPFGYENDIRKQEFRTLLGEIDKQLPFEEQSGMGESDIADRFFEATNGVINSIMKLIRSAAYLAIEQEQEKITLTEFEKAFKQHANLLKDGCKENPFS